MASRVPRAGCLMQREKKKTNKINRNSNVICNKRFPTTHKKAFQRCKKWVATICFQRTKASFHYKIEDAKKSRTKKKEKIIYEKVLLNFFAANIKICSHRLFVDIFFPLTFPPFSRFCYSLFSVYILFTLFA